MEHAVKRRRLLMIVLAALPFVLGSCGFLRDEFWTLDVTPPSPADACAELHDSRRGLAKLLYPAKLDLQVSGCSIEQFFSTDNIWNKFFIEY